MNLRDLEYLVALAEEGNFSRAAVRAGVSQPTLSTQVRKLEAELGVALLERTPGGILFTRAGKQVVARARHVMSDLDEIRVLAQQAADPRATVLTLGMFPTLGPYLLPHMMPEMARDMPDVTVQIVEEKSETLLRQLVAGHIDAITLATQPGNTMPAGETQITAGLNSAELFTEEFILAAPTGHPLAANNGPLRLRDLAGYDVLLLDDGHCLRDHTWSLCQQAGARQTNFRATSLESLRYMVAGGVGVTLLPRLAVTPPVAPVDGLAFREFTPPAPARTINLVWRATSPLAPLIETIAATLQRAYTNATSSNQAA